MADALKIPELVGLDRAQPDYVERLDAGIEELARLSEEHARAFFAGLTNLEETYESNLRGIEGIVINDVDERSAKQVVGGVEIKVDTRVREIFAPKEQQRKLEGTMRTHRRTLQDYNRRISL